ncbi:MAG: T9SS type A sorting domain-containing protein [Bacteroidota bacterium]|jgi:photosystem II stability/assembly factor-like uncharacterized protein
MIKLKTLIFILFILFPLYGIAQSQDQYWKQTYGPHVGANNNNVFIDSAGYLYVTTYDQGLFRSSDNGRTWTNHILDPSSYHNSYSIIETLPNTLFATNGNGVYRSTNHGETWVKTWPGYESAVCLFKLPNGDILCGGNKIFKSTDNGATWVTSMPSYYQEQFENFIRANDGTLIAGSHYGVWKSTDNGDHWNRDSFFDSYDEVFSMTVSSLGTVFVASRNGLFRSTNNGGTWANSGAARAFSVNEFRHKGLVVEAIINNVTGVFCSPDDGLTWSQYVLNGSPQQYLLKIAYTSSGDAFLTTIGPVLHSTDGESTWQPVGLPIATIYTMCVNRHDVIFADNRYRSTDYGETWIYNSYAPYYPYIWIDLNDNIYGANNGTGIYKSTDDGQSWSWIGPNIYAAYNPDAIGFNRRGHIFVHANDGVHRSNDGGISWNYSSTGFPNYFNTFISDSGNCLFAGGSGVYCSTDDGDTWTASNTGLTNLGVKHIAAAPNGDIIVSTSQFTSDNVLFRSTNHGVSWSFIGGSLVDKTINALMVNPVGHIFICTPSGVYRSKNNGLTWNNVSLGLLQSTAAALTIDSRGFMYAGTQGNSVFRTLLPTTQIMFNTATGNFDTVHMGVTNYDTVTVTNLSSEFLNISSIYSTDPVFRIQPISTLLQTGEKKQFIISFSPTDQKEYFASVVFISSSNTSPDTLFLNGAGQAPSFLNIESRKISFGTIPIGSFKDTAIVLNNLGFDTLRFYKAYSADNNFSAVLSKNIIESGNTCQIFIKFAPLSTGYLNGSIILESNSLHSPDTIQVFGNGGIENKRGVPSSFYLEQNYPNPFNGTMSIPFGMPYSSRTVITIFNIQGMMIETILDNDLNGGRYELKWHPTKLASGVYFYRLSAGSFIATKKFILLK